MVLPEDGLFNPEGAPGEHMGGARKQAREEWRKPSAARLLLESHYSCAGGNPE